MTSTMENDVTSSTTNGEISSSSSTTEASGNGGDGEGADADKIVSFVDNFTLS